MQEFDYKNYSLKRPLLQSMPRFKQYKRSFKYTKYFCGKLIQSHGIIDHNKILFMKG